jgi:hypothetical protein
VLKDVPEELIFSAAPYPARTIEPIASALAIELSKYSWWGRTLLLLHEGEERQKHLQAVMVAIKLQLEQIEERKSKLLKEKADMENTKKLYDQLQEELKAQRGSELALKEELETMKTNTVIRDGMMYHSKMSGRGHYKGQRSTSATSVRSNPPQQDILPTQKTERPLIVDDSSDESEDNEVPNDYKDDDVAVEGEMKDEI